MANIIIQNLQELNLNNLKLGKVGRNIKLIIDKQNLNINTGVLYMPFNLNKYKKQWTNIDEYSMDCYVQDSTCVDKLIQLDNTVLELSKNNSQLFGLQNSENVSYSPFYRENKTYPKLLKLYLPRDANGNFTTQFFNENSDIILIDENNIDTILTKKTMFKCIITPSKVWHYQNKIGSMWNIVQLKLTGNSDKENSGSESSETSEINEISESNIYTELLI